MVKKYIVTYDSHQDDNCTFCTNSGIIKFRTNKQGLYDFKNTITTDNSNVVTIVEANMVGFTSRKIDRSKFARDIYSNVVLPTVKNFKHMVSINIISNFQISVSDKNKSDKIYGPSMTREQAKLNNKNDIQITSEIP